MSTSYSLFDLDLVRSARRASVPYQPGSDTSKAAAEAIAPYVGPQGERLYQHILRCGPCGSTDAEASVSIPMLRQSICARRNALMRAGRVKDSGQRRCGGAVWIVVVPS